MRRLYRKHRSLLNRHLDDDEEFGDDENPFSAWSPFGDKDCSDYDIGSDDKASP